MAWWAHWHCCIHGYLLGYGQHCHSWFPNLDLVKSSTFYYFFMILKPGFHFSHPIFGMGIAFIIILDISSAICIFLFLNFDWWMYRRRLVRGYDNIAVLAADIFSVTNKFVIDHNIRRHNQSVALACVHVSCCSDFEVALHYYHVTKKSPHASFPLFWVLKQPSTCVHSGVISVRFGPLSWPKLVRYGRMERLYCRTTI